MSAEYQLPDVEQTVRIAESFVVDESARLQEAARERQALRERTEQRFDRIEIPEVVVKIGGFLIRCCHVNFEQLGYDLYAPYTKGSEENPRGDEPNALQ